LRLRCRACSPFARFVFRGRVLCMNSALDAGCLPRVPSADSDAAHPKPQSKPFLNRLVRVALGGARSRWRSESRS
jgi:hypothetical protein